MSTAGKAYSAAGALEGYEIFVKYLPPDTTEASLAELFKEAGAIVGTPRLMTHPQTGKCKGVGWVTFATQAALSKALTWDGYKFGGRSLSVSHGKSVHTGIRPSVQAHGTHTPALLREVVAKLVASDSSATFVDATFGRGGHTRGMLAALQPAARMHAFDMDPEAISAGNELARADNRFTIHHAPFSSMRERLEPLGARPCAVLFDLGISSPQFDEAQRGFRPEADGPLDLRFDQSKGTPAPAPARLRRSSRRARPLHATDYHHPHPSLATSHHVPAITWHRPLITGHPPPASPRLLTALHTTGVPAYEWLETVARAELIRVLHAYGETTDATAARRIADAICLARASHALPRRTREFAALVAEAKGIEYQAMHPAKLTFQALRIHLNDEFGEARKGLQAAFDLLAEGGRIGVITWKHSECQLVVDFFRTLEGVRSEAPLRRWYLRQPHSELPPAESWSLSMDEATRPSDGGARAPPHHGPSAAACSPPRHPPRVPCHVVPRVTHRAPPAPPPRMA